MYEKKNLGREDWAGFVNTGEPKEATILKMKYKTKIWRNKNV